MKKWYRNFLPTCQLTSVILGTSGKVRVVIVEKVLQKWERRMPVWVIFLFVGLELSFTVAIVGVLLRSSWGQLMKFPSKPLLDPHVRRNFQSFAIGFVNLGGCVHAAIDDDHLHLIPVKFMKWFGCEPVSIPWSEIQDHPKPGRSRYTIRVKIGKAAIVGPRWCLGNRDIFAPNPSDSSS